MKSVCLVVALAALILSSCVSELEPVATLNINTDSLLAITTPIDSSSQSIVSGVYLVESSGNRFGDTVAVQCIGSIVTIFTVKGVVYFAMRGGLKGDTLLLLGYWRGVRGPQTGVAKFVVRPDEGGSDLANGKGNGKGLVLRGEIDVPESNQPEPLVLRKIEKAFERLRGFQIIAHRGGGRNSERLGASENTIELVQLAPFFGATGIEIDIQSTKDGVAVVFHDPTFTSRTVRSPYLIGNVSNYTHKNLQTVARLIYGERIPTLEEVLTATIDRTNLTFVWLDVKAPQLTDSIISIQKRAIEYARFKGRNIQIMFGIPDDDVLNAYRRSPLKGTVPVLCELDVEIVRELDAKVWAPRFTLGIQKELVSQMQKEGRDVYVWTLDDPAFMFEYLRDGDFDGILTNYPTLLAAIFRTRIL
ncbi:MAG: glycerophosphodiester phosphodiesterase [bacterium]|nr:glycerophosphodiester phosphodiesterase [bacterium]